MAREDVHEMRWVQAGSDVLQHRSESADVGVQRLQPPEKAGVVHAEAAPESESRAHAAGSLHQSESSTAKRPQRGAMVTKDCEHAKCGKPFTARRSDHKRGWARYCSKSCKALAQAARDDESTDTQPKDATQS